MKESVEETECGMVVDVCIGYLSCKAQTPRLANAVNGNREANGEPGHCNEVLRIRYVDAIESVQRSTVVSDYRMITNHTDILSPHV